jgi:hypothetical protein
MYFKGGISIMNKKILVLVIVLVCSTVIGCSSNDDEYTRSIGTTTKFVETNENDAEEIVKHKFNIDEFISGVNKVINKTGNVIDSKISDKVLKLRVKLYSKTSSSIDDDCILIYNVISSILLVDADFKTISVEFSDSNNAKVRTISMDTRNAIEENINGFKIKTHFDINDIRNNLKK